VRIPDPGEGFPVSTDPLASTGTSFRSQGFRVNRAAVLAGPESASIRVGRMRMPSPIRRMAGRVAASVSLGADVGLFRTLVARTLADYRAVALRLAGTRRGLRWLRRTRRRLGRARQRSRLFDTPRCEAGRAIG
jgi:hypothetical protein